MAGIRENTVFVKPTQCIDLKQVIKNFILPTKKDCTISTDGFLVKCDEKWNCKVHCSPDKNYFIPVCKGNVLQIMTQFYKGAGSSSAPNEYDSFIEATLCYEDQQIPLNDTKKMSAFGCGKFFQIIEINLDDLPSDAMCFTIHFQATDEDPICTEDYKFVDAKTKGKTIEIQGCRSSGKDCLGHCYELENYTGDLIEFENKMNFYGYLICDDGNIVYDKSDSKGLRSTTVKDEYKFHIECIPPSIKRYLLKSILDSEVIKVDGVEYETGEEISLSNSRRKGMMKSYNITVYKECENKSDC